MKTLAMFGYKRNDLGKAATKAVRAAGKVPCVLYGGKEHIQFPMYESDFKLNILQNLDIFYYLTKVLLYLYKLTFHIVMLLRFLLYP